MSTGELMIHSYVIVTEHHRVMHHEFLPQSPLIIMSLIRRAMQSGEALQIDDDEDDDYEEEDQE
jgi:hypothetical protein